MPPKISQWLEGYVTGLSDAGFSYSRIIDMCKQRNYTISKWTISRICKENNKNAMPNRPSTSGSRNVHPAPRRTKKVVAKVKALVSGENPSTQRSIANRVGVSPATVNRIIRCNLRLVKRHKARGHKLLARHIAERKTNCRKMYEGYLAGERWKFVVTLDEAWIYLDDCNKPRAIVYRERGAKGRSEWVRECRESFSKGFMVVAGYGYNGKLNLHKVERKAKINANYYQANVLEPLYRHDVPRLYGTDANKVWVHQDKASSHTAKSSVAYMNRLAVETGIRAIPYSSIPVKSPDASPMDFCGFGLLKRALGSRRPRTVAGLWKACQEEWDRIPLPQLQSSLLQWKLRCRAIARMGGHHIEHNRWWRRGFT